MNKKCFARIFFPLVAALVLFFFTPLYAEENIDPDDDGSRFAYGENIGWLNADPANSGGAGIEVTESKLTGYIWAENIGWISLSCDNNNVCATSDYGVTNDGNGNLSGYAWSENVGWISFSCENNSFCNTVSYGVTIDLVTKEFSGYAWGENIGWIKFDHSESANRIKTSFVHSGADTDDDGIPDQDDAFPTDPDESSDIDGDGTGDNADTDDDNDGISDTVENSGPNGGDGNNDTVSDRLQNNVASLLSYDGVNYVTMESPAGTTLSGCQSTDNPSTEDAPANIDFLYGFFDFTINGIGPGDSTTLKLYFPDDAVLETYYKYGRTPDNLTDHWYEFLYDGETGAEIDEVNKIITLHFVDAKQGDDILTQDSMVIDLGGPGATSNTPAGDSGGGGSGCFISSLSHR